MKLLVLALAALLGASSLAHADDRRGGPSPERRQRMLERFDTNQDGRLDRRERRQAKLMRRQAKLQKLIRRFDRNGDGNLGPGELPERMQRKLRRFDRNGDGWIDARDQAQPRRDLTPRAPAAPMAPDQE